MKNLTKLVMLWLTRSADRAIFIKVTYTIEKKLASTVVSFEC